MTKANALSTVAVVVPSFGPAVVSIFGLNVPVMTYALSVMGLLLARTIAPASRRKLSLGQEWALNALLALVLLMLVSGEIFGAGKPMRAGLGMLWGIGLGLSGMIAVELFGQAFISALRTMLTIPPPSSPTDDKL